MDPPGMGRAGRTQWGTAQGLHLWLLLPHSGSACSILFLAAWDRQAWHCLCWAAAALQLQLHGGEGVKCLQGRPQCQQQKRQRRGQNLLP